MLLTPIDLAVLAVICVVLGWYWLRCRKFFRPAQQPAELSAADEQALDYLSRSGYQIREIHPTLPARMVISGKVRSFPVRADFLVEKRGKRYLVKHRKGSLSTRLTSVAARRYMLELIYTYSVKGLIVLDCSKQRHHEVSFDRIAGNHWERAVVFLLGFIVGGILSYLRWQGAAP